MSSMIWLTSLLIGIPLELSKTSVEAVIFILTALSNFVCATLAASAFYSNLSKIRGWQQQSHICSIQYQDVLAA